MDSRSRVRQKCLYSGFQIPFPLLKQGNLLRDKTLKRIYDYITFTIHTDLLKKSCTVLQQIILATSIWFTNNTYEILSFSVSVQLSHVWPHKSQHARPLCTSPSPRVHSNSFPLSQWCHAAIWSSVMPFSSCPQSLPASGSFSMSQLFAWGSQRTGVSFSFIPSKEIPGLVSFRMDWLDLLSVQGTLKSILQHQSLLQHQKHQFFGAQLSSQSNSHIHIWPLEKP